jgi:cell division protein FtsN
LQPPPAYAPPPSAARQPYAAAPGAFAPPGFGTDTYHLSQTEQAPDDAGYYEDPPQPKRRMGVMAIAAVLALAVIGTAGAFGYRAMFGGSRSSAPPPVIKADTAPIKVLPAAGSKTPTKLITDRIGDHAEGEKLVSREEKPVAIPPLQGNGQAGAAMPAPGTGVISTEPKKIHTIVIHPDQMGDGQQPPVVAAAPAAPARAAPPQPAANAVPPPPPRPVEARTAAPAQGAAVARGNAPLSLNPDAPATRTMRTAAVAAPAPATQVTHSGGGYAVQVSSQRSEADAQAAFRGLQAKYPNILGGHQAQIHKVELGAKGTYYRAMVGPFANANEASELCNGLKAAGGQCLIQRN